MMRERGFYVAFVKLLWPIFTHVIQTIGKKKKKKKKIYLFVKKAGCQKGLLPIDAGYHTHNKTKIDQIYTNW